MKFYDLPVVPKESFRLIWDDNRSAYYVSEPRIGDTDVFTKEQMDEYGMQCAKAIHNQAMSACADVMRTLTEELATQSPSMRLVFNAIAGEFEKRLV